MLESACYSAGLGAEALRWKAVSQMSKDGVTGPTFSHLPDAINWGFDNSLREDVF